MRFILGSHHRIQINFQQLMEGNEIFSSFKDLQPQYYLGLDEDNPCSYPRGSKSQDKSLEFYASGRKGNELTNFDLLIGNSYYTVPRASLERIPSFYNMENEGTMKESFRLSRNHSTENIGRATSAEKKIIHEEGLFKEASHNVQTNQKMDSESISDFTPSFHQSYSINQMNPKITIKINKELEEIQEKKTVKPKCQYKVVNGNAYICYGEQKKKRLKNCKISLIFNEESDRLHGYLIRYHKKIFKFRVLKERIETVAHLHSKVKKRIQLWNQEEQKWIQVSLFFKIASKKLS